MLDAAIFYLAHGFSIIPLRPRDKRPALPSWADYQSRRATEEEIREWWSRWPDANLGIVTGTVSGLVVLDLDGPDAVDFVKRHGVSATPTVSTGKGWHVYFQHPGQPVQNAAALGGVKGLDIRADGGYVVAPPSVHPSGRQYKWAKGRSPGDLPLAPCPEWLLEILVNQGRAVSIPEPGGDKEPGWVETLLRGVTEGQRDDATTRLAGHYLAKGLPESEVIMLLLAWNRRNQPPLPESQVEKCVRSVAGR
ncbi:MAG: bifunctional DNA primase/polymerase, partial [Desulfotomaculales bacterium]